MGAADAETRSQRGRSARAATSLNSRDLTMIKGGLAPMMKLPLIPVSDGAGDVIETGPGARAISDPQNRTGPGIRSQRSKLKSRWASRCAAA